MLVGPALLELPNAKVGRGRLDPGGPAYKALVLDVPQQRNRVDGMPLAAARRILGLVRDGLPVVVVGDVPDRTGYLGDRDDDPAVRRVLARLLAAPGVRRVSTEAEVPAALEALGVEAAFAPRRPSNVVAAHRSTDGAELYFLYNQNGVDNISGEPDPQPAAFDQEVSLSGQGQPYELDAWTGEMTPIALYERRRGRVATRVRLEPGESTILALVRRGRGRTHAVRTTADEVVAAADGSLRVRETPGTYRTRLSTGRSAETRIGRLPAARTLSSWHVAVEDWRPGAGPRDIDKVPHDLDLTALRSWPEIAELRDVSGIGRYTTRVSLDSAWVSRRRGARLELGPVFD